MASSNGDRSEDFNMVVLMSSDESDTSDKISKNSVPHIKTNVGARVPRVRTETTAYLYKTDKNTKTELSQAEKTLEYTICCAQQHIYQPMVWSVTTYRIGNGFYRNAKLQEELDELKQ